MVALNAVFNVTSAVVLFLVAFMSCGIMWFTMLRGGTKRKTRKPKYKGTRGYKLEDSPFVMKQPQKQFFLFSLIKAVIGYGLLVPIRFVICVMVFMSASVYAYVASIGIDPTKTAPLATWRKILTKIVTFHARIVLFLWGFFWIDVKGKIATGKTAPIIVANHTSLVDALLMFWLFYPAASVSAAENLKYPVIGTMLKVSQAVLLERTSKDSKKKALERIRSRAELAMANPKVPRFFMFPEGTTTNGSTLLKFKLGAFIPGTPVQPVCIRYPFKYGDISWTCDRTFPQIACTMMGEYINYMQVTILDPYVPSEEEKKDAALYASNVRNVMAKELGRDLTKYSMEDALLYGDLLKYGIESSLPGFTMEEITKLYGVRVRKVKQLLKQFATSDKDYDAELNSEEFASLLGVPLTKKVEDFFKLHSKGANGIGFEQYIAIATGCAKKFTDEREALIKQVSYAFERNGAKSLETYKKYLKRQFEGLNEEQAAALVSNMDVNKDDVVCSSDLAAYGEAHPIQLMLISHVIGKQ